MTPSSPPREITGPIVDEHRIKWFEFLFWRPPIDANIAQVCMKQSGAYVEYGPERQRTTGELLFSGIRTVYNVDLGVHVVRIEASPPSRGDKMSFRATMDLVWQVTDPSTVVKSGIRDVRRTLTPSLLHELRSVTRDHLIEDTEQAEIAANEVLNKQDLGGRFGLSVTVYVRLAMDELSIEQAMTTRKVDFFRQIIVNGDFNQFALHLATKPEEVRTVVEMLIKEKDDSRRAVFDFATELLKSDAIDRWLIEDQVRVILQWARNSTNKVLTGEDETRRLTFEAKPDEP
ncbi:hypothetical protein KIPE111705_04340 [Kibdelosporangium persicum]|uniref:Band 7 domain-containing protein n=1 Tax=Kibdelosporangium persicum TaxID=2698649 RepID=A0ABX2F5P6_9PSEU|nr:hypothetical protein [Kibdelosporangium persicum]NRN66513.1 hypothetical protein [Kibdelosporangium persicum]